MINEEYILNKISAGGGRNLSSFSVFPEYLQIETTNDCTARCVMCGINEWHRETNKMSDSLFLKVSNELFEYKDVIQRVSVFLGGEPLLDKKLAEKISILKNGGIKNVFFTTNASLMVKDGALEILESGITQIDISLDSLKKEIYEKIRVGLKFDEVINNVLGLIELRNSGNFDTRIRIRITQMDCNANEIEDFRKFFKDNFKEGDSVYSKNLNTLRIL